MSTNLGPRPTIPTSPPKPTAPVVPAVIVDEQFLKALAAFKAECDRVLGTQEPPHVAVRPSYFPRGFF